MKRYDFQLPIKERRVIPILRPEVKTKQIHDQRPSQPAVAGHTLEITQQDSGTQSEISTPQPSNTDATLNRSEKLSSQSLYDRGDDRTALPVSSPLDVYSRNYVPLWLRAVNESTATPYPSPAFPVQDFASYIRSFVGPNFVRMTRKVHLPNPVTVPVIEQDFNATNYSSCWQVHLQNEFAAQDALQKSFSLFNQKLQLVDNSDNLYALHVPGLRENAPQLDLGDAIHIRPLLPQHFFIEKQVQDWIHHGRHYGHLCPGFTGVLYDPHVWQINRLKEKIVLKIDGFDNSLKCNVVFPLQESKLEPIYRATQAPVQENLWLRTVLFPEADHGIVQTALSPAEFDITWYDNLNREQKKAVHSVVTENYGKLPYLVSGPPGTGKTKTLVELALQMLSKPGHILICAPSDAAADTLALRLSLHLKPNELLRLNGLTRTFAEVPDRLLLYTYSNDSLFLVPPIEQFLSFRIVVTTCRDADLLNRARLDNISLHGLFNGVQRLILPDFATVPLHWTSFLLDEAAQATEPEMLIPLTVMMPPDESHFPQVVAAGDQHQLGPKLATKSKLSVPFFERVFDRDAYAKHPLSRSSGVKFITSKMLPMMRPPFTNLIRNYRSHPAILSVPSSLFYNDTLIPERKSSKEVLGWPGWPSKHHWPVLFYQNNSADAYESILAGDGTGVGTLFNPEEATVAVELVQSLLESTNQTEEVLTQKEITVMSPFKAQVTQLRQTFRQAKLFEVNIGPLEAFQGLESRIVIICTTRTRIGAATRGQNRDHYVLIDKSRSLGVIDEPRRLNVAMTRAQEGLIVIGNAHCLTSTNDESWLTFLNFCLRNHCYRVPPNFTWPHLGDGEILHRQGLLERGLIYAALREENDAGAEQADDHPSKAVDENESANEMPVAAAAAAVAGFRLKGPRQDMDEEMWQFKELAQLRDSEAVDLVSALEFAADREGDVPNNDDFVEQEKNSLDGPESAPNKGYDRNFKQEFHNECNAQ